MQKDIFDLLIIGGGINGVGIATDASGRGLSVVLCEKSDLASGTSWKSSKLIHGGLRYLEYFEFKLVKKALEERETLWRKAPHIIHPLTFVLPHHQHLRPTWLIRTGLFLYDHLGKRSLLPRAKQINLTKNKAGLPLKTNYTKGFTYSDCYVDDARLVVLNAMQAKQLGATILTRTEVVAAHRNKDYWQATLKSTDGVERTVKAYVLVNASGPWADKTLQNLHVPYNHHMSLVKGSHIVVPKLYEGNHAYILQNKDKRIVFVIPFVDRYSLIGTTDIAFTGDLNSPEIDPNEITYLCALVNEYFQKPISPADIVWTYAGVRPLKSDGDDLSAISRDYDLALNVEGNKAPLLNVFGGKLTTYRELAEDALAKLEPFFPHLKPSWTATATLPGGDMTNADFAKFYRGFHQHYPWLPEELAQHYAHNYGTLAHVLLKDTHAISDLGANFGGGLYQREIDYLIKYEWAQTAEDILWRRTKLGLNFPSENLEKLNQYLTKQTAPQKSTEETYP